MLRGYRGTTNDKNDNKFAIVMLQMSVDLDAIKRRLTGMVERLNDKQAYLLPAAAELAGNMRHRIHVLGLNNDNQPIGTYGPSYQLYREKKGKGPNTKVILSFTGRLEADLVPIPLPDGAVGVGYLNPAQRDLADELERRYQQFIFSPSKEEEEEVYLTVNLGVRALI